MNRPALLICNAVAHIISIPLTISNITVQILNICLYVRPDCLPDELVSKEKAFKTGKTGLDIIVGDGLCNRGTKKCAFQI
jgi:hypothetical protein